MQVAAGWWDVYSHLLFGDVDPWWNPAHLTLYVGVGAVIIAVWRGLHEKHSPPMLLMPLNFTNITGLKLAAIGCIMQLVAGVWNELVHHVFLNEPRIAPAHALLTIGMLTINLGMVVGLSIEYGLIKRKVVIVSSLRRSSVYVSVILAFSSIWLASAGAFIYVAGVFRNSPIDWVLAALMAAVGGLVVVPTKRTLPGLGSATLLGFIFTVVAYVLLVFYAGVDAYTPWGIVPLVLVDVAAMMLARMRQRDVAPLSSLVPGLIFYLTYYPFTRFLFPWSAQISIPILLVFVAGALGCLLGHGTYEALSSYVLRDVPH